MDIDQPRNGNDITDWFDESHPPLVTTEPNDLAGRQSAGKNSETM